MPDLAEKRRKIAGLMRDQIFREGVTHALDALLEVAETMEGPVEAAELIDALERVRAANEG